MNTQELFDKVAAHLLKQRKKSKAKIETDEGTVMSCAYRGKGGLMCAVGCLIDDQYYLPELEGLTSYMTPVHNAVELSVGEIDAEQKSLLNDLQSLHDEHHPNAWRRELKLLAEAFGLEWRHS